MAYPPPHSPQLCDGYGDLLQSEMPHPRGVIKGGEIQGCLLLMPVLIFISTSLLLDGLYITHIRSLWIPHLKLFRNILARRISDQTVRAETGHKSRGTDYLAAKDPDCQLRHLGLLM